MIGSLIFSNVFNNKQIYQNDECHCSEFTMCVEGVSPELGSLAFIWWVFLCLYIGSQEKLFRSETKTTFWSAKEFNLCSAFNSCNYKCSSVLLYEALLVQTNAFDMMCSDLIIITETIHALSNMFWLNQFNT